MRASIALAHSSHRETPQSATPCHGEGLREKRETDKRPIRNTLGTGTISCGTTLPRTNRTSYYGSHQNVVSMRRIRRENKLTARRISRYHRQANRSKSHGPRGYVSLPAFLGLKKSETLLVYIRIILSSSRYFQTCTLRHGRYKKKITRGR